MNFRGSMPQFSDIAELAARLTRVRWRQGRILVPSGMMPGVGFNVIQYKVPQHLVNSWLPWNICRFEVSAVSTPILGKRKLWSVRFWSIAPLASLAPAHCAWHIWCFQRWPLLFNTSSFRCDIFESPAFSQYFFWPSWWGTIPTLGTRGSSDDRGVEPQRCS